MRCPDDAVISSKVDHVVVRIQRRERIRIDKLFHARRATKILKARSLVEVGFAEQRDD
jgi:hypothetical protein